jgi:hemerythrin-like domain-containing protein
MDRKKKLELIKGIIHGSIKPGELLPLRYQRLTNQELRFLHSLLEGYEASKSKIIERCYHYYRRLSNTRPISIEEQRGYPMVSDPSYNVPGSDEMVKEWTRLVEAEKAIAA